MALPTNLTRRELRRAVSLAFRADKHIEIVEYHSNPARDGWVDDSRVAPGHRIAQVEPLFERRWNEAVAGLSDAAREWFRAAIARKPLPAVPDRNAAWIARMVRLLREARQSRDPATAIRAEVRGKLIYANRVRLLGQAEVDRQDRERREAAQEGFRRDLLATIRQLHASQRAAQ